MTARYLFVNENIAGHRTVHTNLARVFSGRLGVDVDFMDVPEATALRRIGSSRVPPLDRWDADFQPLRAQVLAAHWVRRRLLRIAEDYDAIHFYTHNAALLSATVMDAVPSVVSSDSTNVLNATRIHGRSPGALTPVAKAAGRGIETHVYRHARRVTPSSQWVADSLIRDYHVDPQRIVVNPMGIEVPALTCSATSKEPKLRIAFVGNPFDRKGGQLLLDTQARRWQDRADLVLVTTSRVPRQPGVEVISDLGAGDPRLWTILQSCDIFAFPSMIDQAPNAVLEAMAAWLPVVAFDVGAIGEMVLSGETGFAVTAGDQSAFVRAVDNLLDSDSLRERTGRAGRQRVETTYSMQRSASRLLDLLVEATWEQSGGPR